MVETQRRRFVAQSLVLDLLGGQLLTWRAGEVAAGREWRTVVDLGGGTGGLSAHLAGEGFVVTVVDPSPDALAALERRAADLGLAERLHGRQGDASDLAEMVGRGEVDVVLCHRVLDVIDAPDEALAAMADALRPGGLLSLLISPRHGLVLTQALGGHLAQALRSWRDEARLSYDDVIGMVENAGFAVVVSHGIGSIADHVPEALAESDARTRADVAELDRAVSRDPAFRALAPAVHMVATRR